MPTTSEEVVLVIFNVLMFISSILLISGHSVATGLIPIYIGIVMLAAFVVYQKQVFAFSVRKGAMQVYGQALPEGFAGGLSERERVQQQRYPRLRAVGKWFRRGRK